MLHSLHFQGIPSCWHFPAPFSLPETNSFHMQDASDKAMGVCVSSYHNENINAPKEKGTLQAFTTFVQSIIPNIKRMSADTYMSLLKHPVDAMFSWAIGVVSGVQDVVSTIDMAHCKLPDFYMKDVFSCSCNDKPYTIPMARAKETYADGAFWCSGTLNMLGNNQNPIVIFNPYSYATIREKMLGLDSYLDCISGVGTGEKEPTNGENCESQKPSIPELEVQGVSSIAVLTRCKANYVAGQWDEGASVLFQADAVYERLTMGQASVAGLYRGLVDTQKVTPELQTCLLNAADQGMTPDACLMDIFLKNRKREDYFVYEVLENTATVKESMYIDACEVFTGPASSFSDPQNEFQYCLDNDLETQCNIPSFIWSGRSKGRSPVANFHSWTDSPLANNINKRNERALKEFRGISNKLSQAILSINQTFSSNNLHAELFSAEGEEVLFPIFVSPAFF